MDRMVEELPQVNLAISLHAATDALRDELVPINRKWPIGEVVGAGRRFAARTGRRVSLEYVMIDGINDTDEQAEGWRSSRAAGARTSTSSRSTRRPARAGAARRGRHRALRRAIRPWRDGLTVRDTRGREIEAACGQLHAQLAGRSLREAREARAAVAAA